MKTVVWYYNHYNDEVYFLAYYDGWSTDIGEARYFDDEDSANNYLHENHLIWDLGPEICFKEVKYE